MSEAANREYYKLWEIVQKYHDHFLKTKAWSITAGSAGLAAGYTTGTVLVFLISALLSLTFWWLNHHYRLNQLSYISRLRAVEESFADNNPDDKPPKIWKSHENFGFREASGRQIFRPFVMMPHLVVCVLAIVSSVYFACK